MRDRPPNGRAAPLFPPEQWIRRSNREFVSRKLKKVFARFDLQKQILFYETLRTLFRQNKNAFARMPAEAINAVNLIS